MILNASSNHNEQQRIRRVLNGDNWGVTLTYTRFFLDFFVLFFFKYYFLSSLTVDYLFYIFTFLLLSFRNIIKYKKIFWARYNIIHWNLIFQYANSLLLNDLDWLCVTLSKVVAFLLICKLLFHINFIN